MASSIWISLFIGLVLSFSVFAETNSCHKFYAIKQVLVRIVPTVPKKQLTAQDQKHVELVLKNTEDFDHWVNQLVKPLKRNEYQDMFFRIKTRDHKYKELSIFRNPDFLNESEFIVTDTLPDNQAIIKNVQYGYQNIRNSKINILGTLLGVELDNRGTVKKVYFKNERHRKLFKAQFLGRPFSEKMKKRILEINTAIFKLLSETPAAVAKVEQFEKKRGWPAGLAKKLGLVYYSRNVLSLKQWAQQNYIRYDELVDAGWLRSSVNHDGRVSFTENFEDSIKIPFYDESDKSKIALWRTRNLGSNPNQPKYLSWPMDRSLYKDAPLFEEFYNSWNLDKVKGRAIVITEGEFKCAIGEIATGIPHLGVPGITQFSPGILEKLVKAQPSEVIVIFDRDPLGKGYGRIDEVTDSQRASYMIAKKIENVGLPVKVAYLPDVYSGKKAGIDDVVLSHGSETYLKTLEQAQSADDFARRFNMDVTISTLSQRRNAIQKALNQFRIATEQTIGSISLEQRSAQTRLESYLSLLTETSAFYFQSIYPGRGKLTDPSFQWSFIRPRNTNNVDTIKSESESFAIEGPVIEIDVVTKEAKRCAQGSCLQIQIPEAIWNRMSDKEKANALSESLETIFPLDDYEYVGTVSYRQKKAVMAILRRDSRTPVAVVSPHPAL